MPAGVLLSIVKEDELKPGDHIYCWRTAFLYAHHGIYMGNDEVIHFNASAGQRICCSSSSSAFPGHVSCPRCCEWSSTNEPQASSNRNKDGIVVSTCLSCFCNGDKLRLFSYSVSIPFLLAQVRDNTCTLAPSDPPQLVLHRARFLLNHTFGTYSLFNKNCIDFAMYCKTGLLIKDDSHVNEIRTANYAIGFFSLSAPLFVGMYYVDRYRSDISIRKDVVKISVERLVEQYKR